MPHPHNALSIGIIDPDPSSRVAVARLLFAHGYHPASFASFDHYAAHKALMARVDVLLVDVREYLGCDSASAAGIVAGSAVIALGDDVRIDVVGRAFAAGCADYLVRPLRSDLMLHALAQVACAAA